LKNNYILLIIILFCLNIKALKVKINLTQKEMF